MAVYQIISSNIISGSFDGTFSGDGSSLNGVVASASPGGSNTNVQFNDSGTTSGSTDFTFDKTSGHVTAIAFSGSFSGDGSGISGVTATLPSGILSSSAQIASEISGAFTEASGGFNDRITNNTNNITNIENTYVRTSVTASMSVAAARYVEYVNVVNKPTIISSSAQIASEISGAFTEASGGFSTRITTLEGAGGGGGSTFPYTGSAIISGSLEIIGPTTIVANSTKVVEVTKASDLPTTLEDNTTYVVRGTVTIPGGSEITAGQFNAIIGLHRDKDILSYSGTGNFINITDETFLLENLGLTSTNASSCLISASNVAASGYNNSRDKFISIINCQFRNVKGNVMDVQGFDLVDFNNTTFFYCESPVFGCRFQDVSKLEISSCEFIRWFDETTIPSPSGYATANMIELSANNYASFGAVNINGCIIHPQQTQNGIYIDPSSTTGFGTIAANAFVTVGLTTGAILGGSTYDSSSMLKYDVGINQGLADSIAYLYGYQSGTDVQGATTTYTQISIASFSTEIETRMSASTAGVTYLGSKPIDVIVQINAGFAGIGGNNEQFDLALYKNTSLINGSERRIELDSGEEGNLALFALTDIVQNDLLTVYYKSPTNDDFTLQNFSIMIRQ
jgi:hypothetical protein